MNKINYLLVIIMGFSAGICGTFYWTALHPPAAAQTKTAKESVYERVMRTQTIRCGYAVWPPNIIKDPNSGKMSGVVYDYVEALGKALNLKIEWAEEMGWGDFPAALNGGRIDGFCAGVWPNASRARQIDFVQPIFYAPIYAYARAGDKRFDNNLTSIDDPSITIATMDGEMSSLIAKSDFPKAKQVQLAQLSNSVELFTNLTSGKADVTFTNPAVAVEYEAKNPRQIYRIASPTPIRVFGDTIAIAHGQDEFRRMLDTATVELLSSGAIGKIIAAYVHEPDVMLPVAPPYQTAR